MKLNRTAEQWAGLSPDAVADSSRTNQVNVLAMMQQDIAELHRRLSAAIEAMIPFAERARSEPADMPDYHMVMTAIGACRRANALVPPELVQTDGAQQ